MPLKPAKNGRWVFELSTKEFILSRVKRGGGAKRIGNIMVQSAAELNGQGIGKAKHGGGRTKAEQVGLRFYRCDVESSL